MVVILALQRLCSCKSTTTEASGLVSAPVNGLVTETAHEGRSEGRNEGRNEAISEALTKL